MLLTKTMFTTMAAAALLGVPAAAQKTADTTVYEGKSIPVWVTVEDVEGKPGVHRVTVLVRWDDARSTLPFASMIDWGELAVLLPQTEEDSADDVWSNGCRYANLPMEHGNDTFQPTERDTPDCLSVKAELLPLVGIDYMGKPMACEEAFRNDGEEDPAIRYYACYWAEVPDWG